MKNTFGSDLSLTIFGESHGRAVGAVLDGMAAGVPVDEAFLAACMDKRRARGDGLSTPRVEADAVQLLSGGLMLGAIFMATDYSTTPVSKKGQIVFGIGCGLLTTMIRFFGGYPEGVCYSILIMNICVWLIDKATLPKRFGVTAEMRKAEKEKAKAAKKAAKEGAEA